MKIEVFGQLWVHDSIHEVSWYESQNLYANHTCLNWFKLSHDLIHGLKNYHVSIQKYLWVESKSWNQVNISVITTLLYNFNLC